MRVLLLALTAAVALSFDASAQPRDARLTTVRTWAFAIGDGALQGDVARRYAGYDLIVVDGEAATRDQLAALHRAGKLALGYVSVGTIERDRGWYRAAKPYRLDYWPDFGEWYANVSRAGYRHLIARNVAPAMLDKGFDGLFLDNTDMVDTHARQAAGMRSLVAALSRDVRRRGALLFTQNGEDSIGPTLRYYEGWNREDVSWTYDFDRRRYLRRPRRDRRAAQAALRRIAGAGLLVTATDYVRAGDAAAVEESRRNACAAGAFPFVSDIGLTRVPMPALGC
jgi:endo-alpha-1,4-polygalactosaminidase (GH114 family)